MQQDRDTYSRTLWLCRGCRYGLIRAAGVVLSETEWGGNGMVGRGCDGLKRPGEETGVLLAVRWGNGEGGRML
jgi:hypothetical protein